MKRIRNLVVLFLTAALLSISAAAANTTPSIEQKSAPSVAVQTSSGAAVSASDITVTGLGSTASASAEVREVLTAAKADLTSKPLTTLVADFANTWKDATGGAPVENAVVANIFDVTITPEAAAAFANNGTMDLTFAVADITAADKVVVLHKVGNDWKVEPSRRGANGEIIVTVSSLSPFAIVVDNGAAPADDGTKSPQTGVSTAAVVLCSVSFAGAGAAFVAKSRRDD